MVGCFVCMEDSFIDYGGTKSYYHFVIASGRYVTSAESEKD